MFKFLFAILFVLTFNLFAATSPFPPYLETRFETIEDTVGISGAALLPKVREGQYALRVAKANWNITDDGGAESTDYALGVSLPANSAVVGFFYRINTVVVSGSDNTVALKCETANDLLTATDLTDSATTQTYAGQISGYATNSFVSDGCELTVSVGSGSSAITAGDIDFFTIYAGVK